ncbi:hypothetical protein, partial [Acidithiobacillus thiooxidans]|uniref:hypothetical protein n=1 Tax=Acidithiobacillus thiooxidans TaxID=930 RepID=UPI001A7E104B
PDSIHAVSGFADRASIVCTFWPSLTSVCLRPEVLHFILERAKSLMRWNQPVFRVKKLDVK